MTNPKDTNVLEELKRAVQTYADRHANSDGLAITPIAGLRMMCAREPSGPMRSMYRPLVCLVLQGAKEMIAGREERVFEAGQSIIVGIDLPVIGRIVEASREKPYLAVAVELDIALLHEMAARISDAPEPAESISPLITVRSDEELLNCATGMMHLLDRPDAAPLLQPALRQELHYWLLTSSHGPALRGLTRQDSYAQRIAGAIEVIRKSYHKPIAVEELASVARMSTSAFRRRFKALTSLSPVQFQKHLRLLEARRLMRSEGVTASRAAHHVGYESVSHFTREYARMFGAPPRRDVRAPPSHALRLAEDELQNRPAAIYRYRINS